MSSLLEVLVTCDSVNTLWTCNIWDPHTGTSLMTYKGGGTAEYRTLSFIGNDYLAAVETAKPILHVWQLNSQQTLQGVRFILPGKCTAFAVSSDGYYCVAGIDEKIYLWQITSGKLLTIISRHYQKVKVLKFTTDGKFIVSAAEDGMVMVWALTTVAAHPEVELVTQSAAGQHDPVYIFSDHSLPVLDICISKTGMSGRLVTVSLDRSCKIYDLPTGEMLLSLMFDDALTAVTMDVLEQNIFISNCEGKIYQYGLTNPPRSRDLLVNTERNCPTFDTPQRVIMCLSVSLDGETLMSASNEGMVCLFHIRSKQLIRTIKHNGSVTNAFFTLNIPAIYQQDFKPNIILHSLERTLERDGSEIMEVEVTVNKKNNFWPEPEQLLFKTEVISKEGGLSNTKENALRDEIEKLKKVNAGLYAFSVQKALKNVSEANNISGKNKKVK